MFNIFKKSNDKRITNLLNDLTWCARIYYGDSYLLPVVSRFGTVTTHIQYIRECTKVVGTDNDLPRYTLQTYASFYDWMDGSKLEQAILLWLTAARELLLAMETTSRRISRDRLLLELPDEIMDIVTLFENIRDETA